MTERQWITHDGRAVEVVMGSWVARLLGMGHLNYGVTLSARRIHLKEPWYTRGQIAHEWGHTRQAEARGWRYLPWVVWGYLTHGYANSPAERDADAYMNANRAAFSEYGPIPSYILRD